MNKLYATCTGVTGIKSVNINESHTSPVTTAIVTAVDENLQIGDVADIYLGYTNNYKRVFRGYLKQKELKVPDGLYTLTFQDYMSRAVDFFVASDNPENPFKRRNISAEDLVGDVLALAGLTSYTYDPTGFTLAINVDAEVNLISAYDYCKSIADIITWTLWADENGTIHFENRKPYIMTGNTGQPGDDFDEREENYTPPIIISDFILDIEKFKDDTNLRNKVVVYGDKNAHATASSSTSYDPDTKTNLQVLPSGFYKTTVIASNLIGGTSLCQKTANYNLDKLNRLSVELRKISIVGNPDIHARMVIRVNKPGFSNNRNWYVYQVEHNFSSSGYVTNILARL
ncbi:MAG: hypothetical protein ACUVT3_02945 [Ignavibacterium sp.]